HAAVGHDLARKRLDPRQRPVLKLTIADGQNLVPAQQIKEAAEEETVLPGEIEGVQIKFGKARGRDRHGDILGQARAKLRLERIEENADDLLAALEMVIEVARADAEILRDARHA